MRPHDRAVILVRHAQTVVDPEVEAAEWKLAGSAGEECRRLAVALRPLRPDRVLTSNHLKAMASGSHLAKGLGLPCETVAGLEEHERTGVPFMEDPGDWLKAVEQLIQQPDEMIMGTETANEALARFEAAVRRELARWPDQRLILASHATVMALFVARYNDLDAFEFWKTIEMPEALVLRRPDFRLLERITVGGASNQEFRR